MEIHVFDTEDVATKIAEVKQMLHMLTLAAYGIGRFGVIDEYDTAAFHTLIDTATERLEALEQAMKPLALGWDNTPLMIVEGEKNIQ
jgi:hypothetical protein